MPDNIKLIAEWGTFFTIGFSIASLTAVCIWILYRYYLNKARIEYKESDTKHFKEINHAIEIRIKKKDLGIEDIIMALSFSKKEIQHIILRVCGESFIKYIMRCRIEIAKELLRSSHSRYKTIAESCGFKNVSELRKYFRKFCGCSLSQFREAYQVS